MRPTSSFYRPAPVISVPYLPFMEESSILSEQIFILPKSGSMNAKMVTVTPAKQLLEVTMWPTTGQLLIISVSLMSIRCLLFYFLSEPSMLR